MHDAEHEANLAAVRPTKNVMSSWDVANNDEDDPVVVEVSEETIESKVHRPKLGSWEAGTTASTRMKGLSSGRHDSDSDSDDAGPPRRKISGRHDSDGESPLRRFVRTGSGSDSDGPPRKPSQRAVRHDSDSDGPPRKPSQRAVRHDSGSDGPPRKPSQHAVKDDSDGDGPPRKPFQRAVWHDSDSDGPPRKPSQRAVRHDSDSDGPPRKPSQRAVKHDGDSDGPLRKPSQRAVRHDSDSDGPPRKPSQGAVRHDSDSDGPPRKPSQGAVRHDRDSDGPPRKPSQRAVRHDSDSDGPPRKPSQCTVRHDSDSDGPVHETQSRYAGDSDDLPRKNKTAQDGSRNFSQRSADRHDSDSDSDSDSPRRKSARIGRDDNGINNHRDRPAEDVRRASASRATASSVRRSDGSQRVEKRSSGGSRDRDDCARRRSDIASGEGFSTQGGVRRYNNDRPDITERQRYDGEQDKPSRRDTRSRSPSPRRNRYHNDDGREVQRRTHVDNTPDAARSSKENHHRGSDEAASQDKFANNFADGGGKDTVKPLGRQRVATTASGHAAGLQTGSQFGAKEKEIQTAKTQELTGADKSLTGENEETVYRDKRGRKLDMLNEMMRQQALREGKALKIQEVTHEWGKGTAQKREVQELAAELERISEEPFARMADNARLDDYHRNVIRDGDPMAEYIARKQRKDEVKKKQERQPSGAATSPDGFDKVSEIERDAPKRKPLYNGPAPTPNRFHIRPGYRWDAIDRGNGFEKKLLLKMNERNTFKEDEYKWSVSDM
jgi:pre-mRNA-splicing factor CWC26